MTASPISQYFRMSPVPPLLRSDIKKKWAPEKILAVATEFASRICEIKGAIPCSKQLYKKFKQVVKDTNFSK